MVYTGKEAYREVYPGGIYTLEHPAPMDGGLPGPPSIHGHLPERGGHGPWLVSHGPFNKIKVSDA